MKKQILSILILAVAIILFNSCEKEEFTPATEEVLETDTVNSTLQDSPNPVVSLDETMIVQIDSSALVMNDQIESRSGEIVVQQFTVTLNKGNWYFKYFSKQDLLPGFTYVVEIVPTYGDPDLYLFADRSTERRLLRSSRNIGTQVERLSVGSNAIYNDIYRLAFGIYATTDTKFLVTIVRRATCPGCMAGKYVIGSKLGTYLDVKGASRNAGTNVWAYRYNGGTAQLWTLIYAGDSRYYIKSDCGTYLDVQGGRVTPQTNVWAYTFDGTLKQQWYVSDDGYGNFRISSAYGNYLEVQDGISASGTNVWVNRFSEDKAQRWQLFDR
ncbi:MAG: RICIN domain-containing protein [Saprospiraceae bacterium]